MVLMKVDDLDYLEEKMLLHKRWYLLKYMVIGIDIIQINIFSS